MRMVQSVSGQNSELSRANHSSRPTVSQLKCVFDTIYQTDLRITNYRRHKFQTSLMLVSFKTRIKWPVGRCLTFADCRLQTADCRQQTADSRLQTADCRLQTADCRLQTADCRLHTTADYRLHTGNGRQTVD